MEGSDSSLNNEKLKPQIPVPYKGYIHPIFFVLAILKVVLGLGLLVIIGYFVIVSHFFSRSVTFYNIALPFAFFIDVIDIAIGFVIVVGVSMRNQELMQNYYRFSIYVYGALTVLCCVLFYSMTRNIGSMLLSLLIFLLVLMMQMYLNHMVKKEVLKLRSNDQFWILKEDTVPQCIYTKQVEN